MAKPFSLEKIREEYEEYKAANGILKKDDNWQKFKQFLQEMGYVATNDQHVRAVYTSIKDPNKKINFDEDFNLEKTGKGSKFGKRVAVSLSVFLTSFLVALGLSGLAYGIGVVSGAQFAGVEVMGNFFKTMINPLLASAGIATVATTIYDLSKTEAKRRNNQFFNYMNKFFGLRFGNSKSMLREYTNELEVDDEFVITNLDSIDFSKFDKLLAKIKKSCEKSFNSKNKKIFNVGRDRFHYLELITRRLRVQFIEECAEAVKEINAGATYAAKDRIKKLVILDKMLSRQQDMISELAEDAKAHALIDCSTSGAHKETLKNLDIAAHIGSYNETLFKKLGINPNEVDLSRLSRVSKTTLKNAIGHYHKNVKYNANATKAAARSILKNEDMNVGEHNLLRAVINLYNDKAADDPVDTDDTDDEPKDEPKKPDPKKDRKPSKNYKFAAQDAYLQLIKTNASAQTEFLDAIAKKITHGNKTKAKDLAERFVKILEDRQSKGRALQSDSKMPEIPTILDLLDQVYKNHYGDTFGV